MTPTASAQFGPLEQALPGEWAAFLIILVGMAVLGGIVLTAVSVAHERTLIRRATLRGQLPGSVPASRTRGAAVAVDSLIADQTDDESIFAPAGERRPIPGTAAPADPNVHVPTAAPPAPEPSRAAAAAATAATETPPPSGAAAPTPSSPEKLPTHTLSPVYRPAAAAGRLPYRP